MKLTSKQVKRMDITELADRVSEGPFLYRPTRDEKQAIAYLSTRYEIADYLHHTLKKKWMHIDPWAVSEALANDVDRVPGLSDDTALQRIVWAIGPDSY